MSFTWSKKYSYKKKNEHPKHHIERRTRLLGYIPVKFDAEHIADKHPELALGMFDREDNAK